jgi:hypothetical protein
MTEGPQPHHKRVSLLGETMKKHLRSLTRPIARRLRTVKFKDMPALRTPGVGPVVSLMAQVTRRTSEPRPTIRNRENRALAQVAKERMHAAANTALAQTMRSAWLMVTSSTTTTYA